MSVTSQEAAVAKIIALCGGDVWGSCAQYPLSAWRHEVEEGNTHQGYWDFVLSSAEADGVNLDDLCSESGRDGDLEVVAHKHGWTPEEIRHARENLSNDYGAESVTPLANGRLLCCPAYPSPCYYVRVTHMGYELAYWASDEFREDAETVLGALIGAARGKSANNGALSSTCEVLPDIEVVDEDTPLQYKGVVRTTAPGSEVPFSFKVHAGTSADDLEDAAATAALGLVSWEFSPVRGES